MIALRFQTETIVKYNITSRDGTDGEMVLERRVFRLWENGVYNDFLDNTQFALCCKKTIEHAWLSR